MGLVQNRFYHSVKVITPRKNYIFEKVIHYGTLYILMRKNDVMHNIFCFIPLIWKILL